MWPFGIWKIIRLICLLGFSSPMSRSLSEEDSREFWWAPSLKISQLSLHCAARSLSCSEEKFSRAKTAQRSRSRTILLTYIVRPVWGPIKFNTRSADFYTVRTKNALKQIGKTAFGQSKFSIMGMFALLKSSRMIE